MFDSNFTFDAAPISPTLTSTASTGTREPSRSVSPCSPTSAFCPPPRFSVTDLAAQFADSRLRADSRIQHDPCEAYANLDDDDADWTIPSIEEAEEAAPLSRSRTFPSSRAFSPSRRTQRQANSRLLCSSAHRRELAALVGQMVERHEQCSVSPPETEDEGYNSAGDAAKASSRRRSSVLAATAAARRPEMSYRRGSDMRSSGCCVSKDVRFRKGSERNHRRVRSGEKS